MGKELTMAIFGNLQLEETVQVDDKTRLNALTTFITPDEAAITLMEIEPLAANGFIDVTTDQLLDWSYSTDETVTVTLRITTDGAPVTFTKTIVIISVVDDKLFSSDAQLLPYEPNILEWVKDGRNSFLDVHRAAQDRIIKWLDENKVWDVNDDPLTKEDIIDISEFNDWSKFMTLKYIFEGISNATDDIFHEKAVRYRELEYHARDRAVIRVDTDNDGDADDDIDTELREIKFTKQ